MELNKLVVWVTGVSGAGKSSALNILEDLGYEVVDNLPLTLLPELILLSFEKNNPEQLRPLAICTDVRTRQFTLRNFKEKVEPALDNKGILIKNLFIDCDDKVLQHRFTETRRRHPLTHHDSILESLKEERKRLSWLRDLANVSVDTTSMSVNEFRKVLSGHFAIDSLGKLGISVKSFAYRYGLPAESDLVLDVRFLRNPHYVDQLTELTGKDLDVQEYVQNDSCFDIFLGNLLSLILSVLPSYIAEGKTYMTISIGCTGGQHRSVVVAEKLSEKLNENGWNVTLSHRDL
tara:strand:- start:23048 stop:23917 length:870 start_codon:yes stop_codon:yes gene_type:complete